MDRNSIRALAVQTLIDAQTLAGFNVISTRTAPLQAGQMPALMVYINSEAKRSLGLAGTNPQFRVTLTLTIQIVVEASDPAQIELQIDTLVDQVSDALLSNVQFVSSFDHMGDVESHFQWHDAEKLDYAEAVMNFELVYDEVYQPNIEPVFTGGTITVDAKSPFDPHGDYTPPFNYPIAPAPRTSGPDGKIDIAATIDIETG